MSQEGGQLRLIQTSPGMLHTQFHGQCPNPLKERKVGGCSARSQLGDIGPSHLVQNQGEAYWEAFGCQGFASYQ